jgi:microcin C transport system permease protein
MHGPEERSMTQNPPLSNTLAYDPQLLQALKERFDYDKTPWQRFSNELTRLLTFRFGDSYFHHKSVRALIQEKLPVSVSLGLITFLLTYFVCIPLGMYRARRDGSFVERVLGVITLVAYSLPSFVWGVLFISLLGGGGLFHLFPIRGLVSEGFAELNAWGKFKDYLHHLCLPALSMSAGSLTFMSMLTKNVCLDQLRQEYVRTARMKGVSEFFIYSKHLFRNVAIPLMTGFGSQFLGLLFTSSLLVESLFSLDGLGLLFYESILHRDYPVVMAIVYLLSLVFIFGNLISDLLYTIMDPRITFVGREQTKP